MVRRALVELFDFNEDGEVNIDDIHFVVVRHEWMFIAGLLIALGSLSNVVGYTSIDSDLFWFFAGVAAMLEYIDDIRRRRKG